VDILWLERSFSSVPDKPREKGPQEKGQITYYSDGEDGSSCLSSRSLRLQSPFAKRTWLITQRNILFSV
jgi:hypothetical protein